MTIGFPFGWAKAAGLNVSHTKETAARAIIPNPTHLFMIHPPFVLFEVL
jgi:hypothetical protein